MRLLAGTGALGALDRVAMNNLDADALIGGMAAPAPHGIQTPYLKQLKATHRARARAAMRWRPKFLSALAVSCNYAFALKAAAVAYNTFRAHQRNESRVRSAGGRRRTAGR